MSRITGSDAQGMMEAYAAVYASQELTEEQIWEEVENWVNSLLEEGYDLSEYTWEEMYEAYIEERRGAAAGLANRTVMAPAARPQIAGGGMGGGMGGRRGGGSSPGGIKPSFQSTGGFGRYAPPSAQVKTPSPAAPAKPATSAAPAKPATSAAPTKPVASASTGTQKPVPTSTSKPSTSTPAAPARPSLASQAAELRQMRARSLERQGKPLSAAAVSATAKPAAFQANSFDPFYEYEPYDLVLEYLLSEGHVETVDEAHYVMMEMDSETIQNICKR